jgi:tetratricopeptide (TPR) repeat protein
VIDPIEISPNLVSAAPSAKMLSTGLLDVLSRIQAGIHTDVERRSLSNAWANDISIEVAETGMSIGQIEHILKTRFGHDQHISGDLVLTEDGGLALTVRGAGILATTFTDSKRNLDKLLTEAGEYIYAQSQPGLWTNYLSNNGRYDDAIQFASSVYRTLDGAEKPYVLVYWANALHAKNGDDQGSYRRALALTQEAVRLKPDFWYGYNDVTDALQGTGQLEAAIKMGEQQIRMAGGRPGRSPEVMYRTYDFLVGDFQAYHNAIIDDLNKYNGVGTFAAAMGDENNFVLITEVLMHDVDRAQLHTSTMQIDEKNIADVAVTTELKMMLAEEAGDFTTAAHEWDAFFNAAPNETNFGSTAILNCYAAPTYEKSGQSTKADKGLLAADNATDGRYYDCAVAKGDVLALRGNWIGAQEWYAKAIGLAPSSPFAYNSYGMALVKHGDLNGAAQQFKLANLKGPHWADPLQAWGDVLMKQGHQSEAIEKYDAALKYAPNWPRLKDARAAAVKART